MSYRVEAEIAEWVAQMMSPHNDSYTREWYRQKLIALNAQIAEHLRRYTEAVKVS